MKEINLWEEQDLINNPYILINDINTLLDVINKYEITMINVTSSYHPNEEPRCYLEKDFQYKKMGIIYNSSEYPVAISKEYYAMSTIDSNFYNQYKDIIIKALQDNILKTTKEFILINKDTFNDDIFKVLLNKKDTELEFYDVILTEEQIKLLQDNNIHATVNGKIVSSFLEPGIGNYTHEDLLNNDFLIFDLPLTKEEMNNLQYISPQSYIIFNNSEDELNSLINLKEILEVLDKLDKSLTISIDISRRSNFEKAELDNLNLDNISLIIENDNVEYTYEEFMEENKLLDSLISDIKDLDLSPLEKYIYVYNLVKNYKNYKENDDNYDEARILKYVLKNDYIVCVGFERLLETLLDKVGISCKEFHVDIDTSYDDDNLIQEKIVTKEGHMRAIIRLDDDKYKVHGLFVSEPTFANMTDPDFLNFALMNFDQMQISNDLYWINDELLLFDVHNIDEFIEQINYMVKRELKHPSILNIEDKEKQLLSVYQNIYYIIKNIFSKIDYNYFNNIRNKYNFNNLNDHYKFLKEIGYYIVQNVNKNISSKTIINAFINMQKKILKNNKEALVNKRDALINLYNERQKEYFPYKVSKEKYLEDVNTKQK